MNTNQLAKLTTPTLVKDFKRTRLFDHLQKERDRSVYWICAPAGFGKTSLISSYLKSGKKPHLWYQLDAGDQDAASFFHYMNLAARSLAGEDQLPRLTPEHGAANVKEFARVYFRHFYQLLPRGTALVFDNFHDVPGDTFAQVMQVALSEVPNNIQVYIISRLQPPSFFSRMRASEKMMLLSGTDISLSRDETIGIGKLYNQSLTTEWLENIHSYTQGWVAGLILMLEEAQNRSMPDINTFKPEAVFNYFAEEIFLRANKSLQTFLMKTAVLPNMHPDAVIKLSGENQSATLLQDLAQKNYFTFQLDANTFEYHPLFKAFLTDRAARIFDKQALHETYLLAAKIMEESRQESSAIDLLLERHAWPEAIEALERHAGNYFRQGRGQTLEKWLDTVSREHLESHPWLLYWKAMCMLIRHPLSSQPLFQEALSIFDKNADGAGVYLSWSGMVESIWIAQSDSKPLDGLIENFVEFDRKYAIDDLQVRMRAVNSMIFALLWRQPDHPHIEKWTEEAVSIWRRASGDSNKHLLGMRLGFYFSMTGHNSDQAGYYCTLPGDSARPAEVSATIFSHLMLAYLKSHGGDPEGALEDIETALDLGQKFGLHTMDGMLLIIGGYVLLFQKNNRKFEQFMKKLATFVSNQPVNIHAAHYHMLLSRSAFVRDDYNAAYQNAKTALEIAESMGAVYPLMLARFFMAQALYQNGRPEEARADLKTVREMGKKANFQWMVYISDMLNAKFNILEENADETYLLRALQRGCRANYGPPLVFQNEDLSLIYTRAIESEIEHGYVSNQIRKLKLLPVKQYLGSSKWPWPICIYTLGSFSIHKDGKPFKETGRTQQKPLALLKTLLALGGRDVSQVSLTDHLWPDADGDAGRRAFNTTLHRLRKLLGYDQALVLQDGKLSLDPRYCWVDAWCFENIYNDLQHMLSDKASSQEQITAMARQAMDIYRGTFLKHDSDEIWALTQRDRLHHRILNLVKKLASYFESVDQTDVALGYYQKGLEIDDLIEDFYQNIIRLQYGMGRHAEALGSYDRCKKTLQHHLGILPSPVTEQLRRQLSGKSNVYRDIA